MRAFSQREQDWRKTLRFESLVLHLHREGDLHVTLGGVGVRAHRVRIRNNLLEGSQVTADGLQRQLHLDVEPTGDATQANLGGQCRGGVQRDSSLTSNELDSAQEASRIASSEQLLRVHTAWRGRASHLHCIVLRGTKYNAKKTKGMRGRRTALGLLVTRSSAPDFVLPSRPSPEATPVASYTILGAGPLAGNTWLAVAKRRTPTLPVQTSVHCFREPPYNTRKNYTEIQS